jgi:hypothetical protein
MPKPLELQATLKSECNVNTDGWLLYNPDMEFARMGIPEGWTWTDINRGHEVCKSYPERLIIPAKIPDEKLRKAANFRTKGRIPMLSWVHKNKVRTGFFLVYESHCLGFPYEENATIPLLICVL